MSFLNRRLGFDVSYYNNQNINQIPAISLRLMILLFIECWNYENKGVEVQFNATHLKLLISDGFKPKLDNKTKLLN
jgi:hypothetical protein